ncbi:hypothetical protein HMI55_006112 [Coelomomyces lativittatus]|nr:hypothetical protein HMI56_007585 [Coelomomyces lativittatus]KAJ1517753.1 hypothetical protein HMI55_006112 [Coelomomyces lativittatus]
MEKIIQSHPFYPFFQEITQLRQRASLSLHSNEIQSILNEVHDSFENFFSKHQPYNEHDALLLNGVLTMVAHILEIYEHTLKFETDFIEAWQECYPATWSSLELPSTLKIKKTKRTNHRQEATDLLKVRVHVDFFFFFLLSYFTFLHIKELKYLYPELFFLNLNLNFFFKGMGS